MHNWKRASILSIALGAFLMTGALSAQLTSIKQASPLPFSLGPVYGFADYHAHQMGQLGFGGRLMYGSHKGPEHIALKSCTGMNHAVSWLPIAGSLMHQPDLGQHPGQTYGYHSDSSKRYKHWPTWITTTHQGYWEGHLYKAYQDGLRLFVMSAVNFDMFCSILPKKNTNSEVLADLQRNPQDQSKVCDDMVNIRRQIRAAKEFAASKWWYEIAYTPQQARSIMNRGRMAVVLAVEASKIWGSKSAGWSEVLSRLNTLQNDGVRSFQLVHEIDNNIGGPAVFHFMFNIFNAIDNVFQGNGLHGFSKNSYGHNALGLTNTGKQLVRELMRRKMIVDVAHNGERMFNDAYAISVQNQYYPLFVSHGHFRDLFHDKHADEKKNPWYGIKKLKATGGVYGLRTGPERTKSYTRGGIANNCHGSSRSFAQSYQLGRIGYGINIGFGVDMTGMIAQMRPRFYDSRSKWSGNIFHGGRIGINSPATWACGGEVVKKDRDSGRAAQGSRSTRGLNNDFDLVGFGNISHVKNVIRDLNKIGVNTSNLEDSGENFVRMWERIHSTNRGKVYDGGVTTSGIDHSSLTDMCPGNLPLGIAKRTKVGAYYTKRKPQPYGSGIPHYVPICKAFPHTTIQNHNCSGYGFKNGSWCIKRRDNGKWYSARQLVADKCPIPHSKISGSYGGKIVCKTIPHVANQNRNCSKKWGSQCIVATGSYYVRVRSLTRDKCPVPYRYVKMGPSGKIICKPTPHFKIKSRKCSYKWGGYCLWNQGYWWKGRQLK